MNTKSKERKQLYKTFFKYVSLNVISMIGFSAFILADTFFIANGIGKDGLVSLNLVIPAYTVVYAMSLLLGTGVGTVYSIYRGEKKPKRGNEVFTQMMILGVFIGLLFTIIGLLFPDEIVMLLGAEDHLVEMSRDYTYTVFNFSIAFMVNSILVSMVRNDGHPRLAMIAMMTGSLSNILLDYIFIYPLGMGMFGAALATGIAPILSILVMMPFFLRKKHHFRFVKTRLRPLEIRKVVSIGIPTFITELSSGLVILLFNLVILHYIGEIGVAAYGIIANLALILIAIFSGVGQGIQPIISFNHGQKNQENVRRTLNLGILFSAALALFLYGIFIGNSDGIIRAFNSENNLELHRLAKEGMRIYFSSFLFAGINITIISYFSAKAKPRPSFIVSLLRGILLIPPVLLFLAGAMGITGVWITIPLVELLTLLISLTLLHMERRKKVQLPS
ncbi:MATE family efflux transporter [Proteiniclasticum sp. SCR006]|uniref:Multidrug export protein MepA n=1 Tax=Proteiniclasticum aestuarii TaxID=2817862 RepID=A0A939H755_9CLOT|nr:MATE family efflux transporter [Proteiniclasticum aestuarii]MBO1265434.1 MATE family efflux transporter [Proteiniclasticum aestuarii]